MQDKKKVGRGAITCLIAGSFIVIIPIVAALVGQDVPVSADTMNAEY